MDEVGQPGAGHPGTNDSSPDDTAAADGSDGSFALPDVHRSEDWYGQAVARGQSGTARPGGGHSGDSRPGGGHSGGVRPADEWHWIGGTYSSGGPDPRPPDNAGPQASWRGDPHPSDPHGFPPLRPYPDPPGFAPPPGRTHRPVTANMDPDDEPTAWTVPAGYGEPHSRLGAARGTVPLTDALTAETIQAPLLASAAKRPYGEPVAGSVRLPQVFVPRPRTGGHQQDPLHPDWRADERAPGSIADDEPAEDGARAERAEPSLRAGEDSSTRTDALAADDLPALAAAAEALRAGRDAPAQPAVPAQSMPAESVPAESMTAARSTVPAQPAAPAQSASPAQTVTARSGSAGGPMASARDPSDGGPSSTEHPAAIPMPAGPSEQVRPVQRDAADAPGYAPSRDAPPRPTGAAPHGGEPRDEPASAPPAPESDAPPPDPRLPTTQESAPDDVPSWPVSRGELRSRRAPWLRGGGLTRPGRFGGRPGAMFNPAPPAPDAERPAPPVRPEPPPPRRPDTPHASAPALPPTGVAGRPPAAASGMSPISGPPNRPTSAPPTSTTNAPISALGAAGGPPRPAAPTPQVPTAPPSHTPTAPPSHTPTAPPSHTPTAPPSHTPTARPSQMPTAPPSQMPTARGPEPARPQADAEEPSHPTVAFPAAALGQTPPRTGAGPAPEAQPDESRHGNGPPPFTIPGQTTLPHRVPGVPDVPYVDPEDLDDEVDELPFIPSTDVDGPDLSRIASHLRHDEESLPELPEELDVGAVLAAVRQVHGVRSAQLRPNPGGVHILRLDLADDADAGRVSRQVARLLKERMGLAAEPRRSRSATRPEATRPEATRPDATRPEATRPEDSGLARPPAAPSDAPPVEHAPPGPASPQRSSGGSARSTPAPDRASASDRATIANSGATGAPGFRPAMPSEPGGYLPGMSAVGTPRPIDPVPGQPPRIVLDQVHVSVLGTEATVEVRLHCRGRSTVGRATGPAVDAYLLRLAAQAAAGAIDALLAGVDAGPAAPHGAQGPIRCFVEHAGVVPFGNCVVAVVVMLISGDGRVEQLVGSALVQGDPRQSIVRATLAAVNRRLEGLLM